MEQKFFKYSFEDVREKIETYFQFPLSSLSLPLPFSDILEHIVAFSIFDYSQKLWNSDDLTDARIKEMLAQIENEYSPDEATEENVLALMSAQALNERIRNFGATKARYQKVYHHAIMAGKGDLGALVRIRTDIFDKVKRKNSLSEREFRLLCAIYSGIGKQKMRRITKEELQQRSLGYPSANRDVQKDKWLSDYELRLTRDRLHKLNFFSMLTYARRQTYYSNRLQQEELHALILKAKTELVAKRSENRIASDELTRQVRERLREKRLGLKATISSVIENKPTTHDQDIVADDLPF